MGVRTSSWIGFMLLLSVACSPIPTPTPELCEFAGHVVSEGGGSCVEATATPTPTPTATPTPTPIPTPTPRPPTPTPCPGSCLMHTGWWDAAAEPLADEVAESVVKMVFRFDGTWDHSIGTGFIIGIDEQPGQTKARVLTAYHVISQPTIEEVEAHVMQEWKLEHPTVIQVLADAGGRIGRYDAEVVEYDSELDVALLSICCIRSGQRLRPAELSEAVPYYWFPAFTIGFGKFRDKAVVRSGKVLDESSELRFDAGSLPGDSGSPIFDAQTGEVVGMIVASIERSASYIREGQGVGVSIEAIRSSWELGAYLRPTPTPSPTPHKTYRIDWRGANGPRIHGTGPISGIFLDMDPQTYAMYWEGQVWSVTVDRCVDCVWTPSSKLGKHLIVDKRTLVTIDVEATGPWMLRLIPVT